MRLYYFDRSSNFGDSLNSWLWRRLLPQAFDTDDGVYFAGIGTIINSLMPPARRWIVFGSGVGYGAPPADFGGQGWDVLALRGPLSAAALGLAPETAVTDGAILLATLPDHAPLSEGERRGVVFVPHFEAERGAHWPSACAAAGVEYVNPLDDSRSVIARIRTARLVIAEAMHAAIVADTLRVPWLPVVSSPQVSTFKWLDWTRSMGLPYAPRRLRPSSTASQLRNMLLWAYGQEHAFRDHGDAAALGYLTRRYGETGQPGRRTVDKLGRRLHRRAERLVASSRLAGWRTRRDAELIDRAAGELARLGSGPGMLSAEPIFRQRLDALSERLAGVG